MISSKRSRVKGKNQKNLAEATCIYASLLTPMLSLAGGGAAISLAFRMTEL
jgi:hypothetical protein